MTMTSSVTESTTLVALSASVFTFFLVGAAENCALFLQAARISPTAESRQRSIFAQTSDFALGFFRRVAFGTFLTTQAEAVAIAVFGAAGTTADFLFVTKLALALVPAPTMTSRQKLTPPPLASIAASFLVLCGVLLRAALLARSQHVFLVAALAFRTAMSTL